MSNEITISTGSGSFTIPHDEFEISYARSGGPGGQNVNKVSSMAVLHWPVTVSPSLPDDVRARFLEKYGSQLTKDGEIVVKSREERDQHRNRQNALDKIQRMVESVAAPPTERVATKPTKSAKKRRLDDKGAHSKVKEGRRWRPSGGDY
jgi:ribosome-associated protein